MRVILNTQVWKWWDNSRIMGTQVSYPPEIEEHRTVLFHKERQIHGEQRTLSSIYTLHPGEPLNSSGALVLVDLKAEMIQFWEKFLRVVTSSHVSCSSFDCVVSFCVQDWWSFHITSYAGWRVRCGLSFWCRALFVWNWLLPIMKMFDRFCSQLKHWSSSQIMVREIIK